MVQDMIFSLPVECKVLFSNHKDVYKARIEHRQRRFVTKLSFIKPFLQVDENILLVTTGYSPMTTFAQWLYGFLFIFLKRSLLVFTNKRIFIIPTRMNYSYRRSIAHIPYGEAQELSVRRRTLIVKCRICGQAKKIIGISGKEIKKIKAMVTTFRPDSRFATSAQMTHLCPRCTRELHDGAEKCKNCKQQFLSAKKTRLWAFLIPGGGYFYLDHYLLGAFSALVEVGLLVLIVVCGFRVYQDADDIVRIVYLGSAILALVCLKFMAAYHSSLFTNEFIPAE